MPDFTGKVQLDGAQNYELILDIDETVNAAANSSSLAWKLRVNDVNNYGSFGNYATNWSINVGSASSGTIPSFPAGDFTIASGTKTVTHNSDGTKTLTVTGAWDSKHSNIGKGTVSYSITLTKIANGPAVPTGLTLSNVTPVSMRASWNAVAGATSYRLRWSEDPAFVTGVSSGSTTGATLFDIPNLKPNTKYYVQVRAANASGDSALSSSVNATTLTIPAPSFTVVPSASGLTARLTFSPPAGIPASQILGYQYEYTDITAGGAPVLNPGLVAAVADVGGLIPGHVYDWRARATLTLSRGISPYTALQRVTQPRPAINPGDYFDGDTPGTADVPPVGDFDYQWTGTAQGSTSIAVGLVPEGWELSFGGAGTGVLYRVTAGLFGDYAARAVITRDATVAGVRMGQRALSPYWTGVVAGETYVGSIHVKLSRGNSMAAEITWLTSGGAVISRTVGAATSVPSGDWYRLVAGGTVPATTAYAVVRAIDVAGTGWSLWQAGDIIDLDGAMVSFGELYDYFDGSFAPDGTFVYAWTGTANASTSSRTPIAQASAAVLEAPAVRLDPGAYAIIDPACAPPAPPRPPVVPNACITDAGVWRRKLSNIPATLISEYLDVVPTFEITTRLNNVSQLRIRVYENPDGRPAEQVDTSRWISEQIVSYIPKNTVLTIDGALQRAYASVAGGASVSADSLLYGSKGAPPTWPVLSCGMGYTISADLPIDVPQLDATLEAFVTTRY